MTAYTRLVRPLLFRGEAERMHDRALRLAARVGRIPGLARLLRSAWQRTDPSLRTEAVGADVS
ncbi:MAG: hypothetical protein AB1505_07720 [Candidatus Latescibacterota bacterium]